MHRNGPVVLLDQKKNEDFLNNVDFVETAKNISTMMLALNKYSEMKGIVCYCKSEIIHAKDSFLTNPCFDTAVRFIKVAPYFTILLVTNGSIAYSEEVWLKVITGLNL